jgi:tetratricopeptide (TPR) repeat protein
MNDERWQPVRVGPTASALEAHIDAMLTRLEAVTDRTERARLLVEIGVAFEHDLGDHSQAVDALLEAWREDPTLAEVLTELEKLARAANRLPEILAATSERLASETDRARSIAYAEAMVRWYTNDLPAPDQVRRYIEHIKTLDATHPYVRLVQAEVFRLQGDLKHEREELDRALLGAKRPDDRTRIHLVLAARMSDERTGNVAAAKKHLEAAHQLFPEAREPLAALASILEHERDWVALAEVLRRRALQTELPLMERVVILRRVADLEEGEFRKPELAARTLERLLALDADNALARAQLERCLVASRSWKELAELLEREAGLATDTAHRAARLKQRAEILEFKVGDPAAAALVHQELEQLLPGDEAVVAELARVTEKTGDARAAAAWRARAAELATDPAARARAYVMAGQLLVAHDPGAARAHFESAARADPKNEAAYRALRLDAQAAGDLERAARYAEERAGREQTPRARAAHLVELAEIRRQQGDESGAYDAYTAAAENDPSNAPAAAALVESMVSAARWQEAEPLCPIVVAAAERAGDTDRLFAVRRAVATVMAGLGKHEQALTHAAAAYRLWPESTEAKEGLVSAAAKAGRGPGVAALRDVFVAMADAPAGLSRESRAELGDVLAAIDEGDRARVLYDEVLEEAPLSKRALAGLALQHDAAGDLVATWTLRRKLAGAIEDPGERFKQLVSVGDAFLKQVERIDLAVEAYEEARALRPKDLTVLHRLLDAYRREERWANVFAVLRAIAESETNPAHKSRSLFAMAQLARGELADRGEALALLEQVLAVDPSPLEAFERISQMLTKDKDWMGLAQMYVHVIPRAQRAGDRKLEHALYHQLGLIYRDRLGDEAYATRAFEAAVALRPEVEEDQAILRELLASTGHAPAAAAIALERVRAEPLDPAPYTALVDLLVGGGEYDRAWAVGSVMRFLGLAHPHVQMLHERYGALSADRMQGTLGAGGVRALFHPELDPTLTAIFDITAPAVVALAVAKLPVRDRVTHPGPPLTGHDWLYEAVGRAASVLGVPAPHFHARRLAGRVMQPVPAQRPGLYVDTTALPGVAPEALWFIMGKHLAELVPAMLVRAMHPSTTELKGLVAASSRIATGHALPADAPLRALLRKEDVAHLAAAVGAAHSGTGVLDVSRWSKLADVSTSRVGLFLAGDLVLARAALALEPQSPTDLSPRDKMQELARFFLSDGYAQMRRALGVALG